jgi:hypothetical protein
VETLKAFVNKMAEAAVALCCNAVGVFRKGDKAEESAG